MEERIKGKSGRCLVGGFRGEELFCSNRLFFHMFFNTLIYGPFFNRLFFPTGIWSMFKHIHLWMYLNTPISGSPNGKDQSRVVPKVVTGLHHDGRTESPGHVYQWRNFPTSAVDSVVSVHTCPTNIEHIRSSYYCELRKQIRCVNLTSFAF